jgi:hypothetical protein
MDLNLRGKSSSKSGGLSSQSFGIADDYDYDEEDLNVQVTDEENIFMEESDIISEREKIIKEAMEKLFLERNEAILVMIYYEWNLDKLDNWYEDVDQNRIKAGLELSEKN